MKTAIITLSIVIFAIAGNINDAFSKENYYKNNEVNQEGQITKTTVCIGENGKNLTPVKQFENKYDSNGKLSERILSVWDSRQSKWNINKKYQYEYSADGQLQMLSYMTFDESKKTWEDAIKYAMYIYNPEGTLLLVNYLDTQNTEYEALASNFSIK